jgi:DNA-3-methyladenine glycosylase
MHTNGSKLKRSFYERNDVVKISRQLIGKILCTRVDNQITAGMITETEAYCGLNDKACHANNGLRTNRTETMYGPGGHSYIYLCYGIHHLFNVVTNTQNRADAVLIRSIQPIEGEPVILQRRERNTMKPGVCNGPGKLTRSLAITTQMDGTNLTGNLIWIEDRGRSFNDSDIAETARIGVEYAGADAKRPWRFYLKDSVWVSKR